MKRIKSKFPLADIFNFVLGKLSVLESISKPVTFSSRDNALPALYYDVVLYEKYLNDTMSKLMGWIDTINQYKSVGYDHSRFVEMKTNEYRETCFLIRKMIFHIFLLRVVWCVKIIGILSWIALMMTLQV